MANSVHKINYFWNSVLGGCIEVLVSKKKASSAVTSNNLKNDVNVF